MTYAVRVVGQVLGEVGLRIVRANVLQLCGQAVAQRMEVAAQMAEQLFAFGQFVCNIFRSDGEVLEAFPEVHLSLRRGTFHVRYGGCRKRESEFEEMPLDQSFNVFDTYPRCW